MNTGIFFNLINNAVTGAPLPPVDKRTIDYSFLYRLSRSHDVAHLICYALEKNGLIGEGDPFFAAFEEEKFVAVYREAQITEVYERIRALFTKKGIKYLPLKGSVIRPMYEQAWMRTSCDIDVLIEESSVLSATKALKEAGFTTDGKWDYHDVSFYYNLVQLELHFTPCDNIAKFDKLLCKVWENATTKDGVEYLETPDFFAFHHVEHMARHFMAGGCGVKPFIDLLLMKKKGYYNENVVIDYCKICSLDVFYDKAEQLIGVWFEGKEKTEELKEFETFILRGGVYGTSARSHLMGEAKTGSRIGYVLKMLFPPYANMYVFYPTLRKHPLMLPFFYVHRLFSKVFGKDSARARNEYKKIYSQKREDVAAAKKLLKDLKL